jgi:hypothetical protein
LVSPKILIRNVKFSHGLSSAVFIDSVMINSTVFNEPQIFPQSKESEVVIDNCYFVMIDAIEEAPLHFAFQFDKGNVTNCCFAYCSSQEKAGAFHCDANTNLNISNLCVSYCRSDSASFPSSLFLSPEYSCFVRSMCISDCNDGRGELFVSKKSSTIKLANISKCKGKAIFHLDGQVQIIDYLLIHGSTSTNNLLELFAYSYQKIEHSYFADNKVSNALVYFSYSVSFNYCNMTNNEFAYFAVGSQRECIFSHCLFDFNESLFKGGLTTSCSFNVSGLIEPVVDFDECLVYATPSQSPSPTEVVVKQDIISLSTKIFIIVILSIIVLAAGYFLYKKMCNKTKPEDTDFIISNMEDSEQLVYSP